MFLHNSIIIILISQTMSDRKQAIRIIITLKSLLCLIIVIRSYDQYQMTSFRVFQKRGDMVHLMYHTNMYGTISQL